MQLKTRARISLHKMKSAYRYLGITIRAALVLACMRIDETGQLEVTRLWCRSCEPNGGAKRGIVLNMWLEAGAIYVVALEIEQACLAQLPRNDVENMSSLQITLPCT